MLTKYIFTMVLVYKIVWFSPAPHEQFPHLIEICPLVLKEINFFPLVPHGPPKLSPESVILSLAVNKLYLSYINILVQLMISAVLLLVLKMKFNKNLHLGGGAPLWGHMVHIPKDDPTKVDWNFPVSSGEENEKIRSLCEKQTKSGSNHGSSLGPSACVS